MKEYYKILNLPLTASRQEIRRAYLKLALIHHPDKPGGNQEKFLEVKNAYEKIIKNLSGKNNFSESSGSDSIEDIPFHQEPLFQEYLFASVELYARALNFLKWILFASIFTFLMGLMILEVNIVWGAIFVAYSVGLIFSYFKIKHLGKTLALKMISIGFVQKKIFKLMAYVTMAVGSMISFLCLIIVSALVLKTFKIPPPALIQMVIILSLPLFHFLVKANETRSHLKSIDNRFLKIEN